MDNLKVFENEELGSIRTVMIDNIPYFVGKDVATILGYTNTSKAIRDHVSNEDKQTERIVMADQSRNMIIINESGMYALIFSSKLDSAKKFKYWITSEVLPAIRQTGTYSMGVSNRLRFMRLGVEPKKQGRITIRVSAESYSRIEEIAMETGLSMKRVADRMLGFAYQHTELAEDTIEEDEED